MERGIEEGGERRGNLDSLEEGPEGQNGAKFVS
jgi:hypothetical protein